MATAIKLALPDSHVAFLVRPYVAPLLKLAPDVDETILYDPEASLLKKIDLFRSAEADVVMYPSPRPETVIAGRLASIPVRIGTKYRYYSPLFTHFALDRRKKGLFHESEFNVRMLHSLSIQSDSVPPPRLVLRPEDELAATELLQLAFGDSPQEFCVFHVPSGGSSPRWSASQFALLGEWVARRLSLPILLSGTETEREMLLSVKQVMESLGARVALATGAALTTFAALLATARFVVANSTGPGHLAAAVGAPTVGLFPLAQGLSAERWGFRGPQVRNLSPSVPPRDSCPGCKECICLSNISQEQVTTAIEDLVKRQRM